jgi:argininosuccinate lyase
MKKLWGGRFQDEADDRVMEFTGSFRFDVRLLPYDIKGSIAHARMLQSIGVLSREEGRSLIKSLEELLLESPGSPLPEAEDVHTYVENRLREKVGDLAGRLHTARSRNDQVATDMKLFLMDATGAVLLSLGRLRETLVSQAEENLEVIMPGYTHLQPAQPILLSHHLMSYYEKFRRDSGRFRDARERASELPLGSGALAGTSFPVDREMVAAELGFREVARNSLDAVSERDFPLEFTGAAAITMVHLSRLCEELIIWASPAFGFIDIPDRLATGSSMMPQKKNPDVAELIRAKSGRVFGSLMALLSVMKGLPLAYQRDLQEDKEAVFDVADTLRSSLDALQVLMAGIRFDGQKMASEARRGHTVATDMAEYLVGKGMSFREAHQVVGTAVREAVIKGINIDELSHEDLIRCSENFDEGAAAVMTPEGSVKNKKSGGSTAPNLVAEAVKRARGELREEGDSD